MSTFRKLTISSLWEGTLDFSSNWEERPGPGINPFTTTNSLALVGSKNVMMIARLGPPGDSRNCADDGGWSKVTIDLVSVNNVVILTLDCVVTGMSVSASETQVNIFLQNIRSNIIIFQYNYLMSVSILNSVWMYPWNPGADIYPWLRGRGWSCPAIRWSVTTVPTLGWVQGYTSQDMSGQHLNLQHELRHIALYLIVKQISWNKSNANCRQ